MPENHAPAEETPQPENTEVIEPPGKTFTEIIEVTPEPEPEPEAAPVEVTASCDGKVQPSLTDGNWRSRVKASSIRIESTDGSDIGNLYVIWYTFHDAWTITYPDGSTQPVDTDYLHEPVKLIQPANSITLTLSAEESVGTIYAYSEGSFPESVQTWERMDIGDADIMIFPAHADDEYVFFGGMIPYYAGELGYKVQVCWTTYHDAIEREHEKLDALWHAGCRYYPETNMCSKDPQLGYAPNYNSALSMYGREPVEEYIVECIRKYKPYVVVGHDGNGEYGHGMHILSSEMLTQAYFDAQDETMFEASAALYGTWQPQKEYLHLYGDNPVILDYDIPLENFGGKTAFEVAKECYAKEYSQYVLGYYTVYYTGHRYNSAIFGLRETVVGEDIHCADIMENVAYTKLGAELPKAVTGGASRSELAPRTILSAAKYKTGMLDEEWFAPALEEGRVEQRFYISSDVETGQVQSKTMLVYTPYGYSEDEKYDVLILCHGTGGDENYWFAEETDERGVSVSLKNLLDNMIERELCKPLIVVSTTWKNDYSCSMKTYGMSELEIASLQQAGEMRMDILPFIVENYSTYAEGTTLADLKAARDHFGYAGLSWGSMTCVLGQLRENTEYISWFGSFAPGLFNLYDTGPRIAAAAADGYPVNAFLMLCGTADGELPKSTSVYNSLLGGAGKALTPGINTKFIEVENAGHWYGCWMTGAYDCLLTFFAQAH